MRILLAITLVALTTGCPHVQRCYTPTTTAENAAPAQPELSSPPLMPADATALAAPESTEARQAATRFLQAIGDKDWNAVAKFWPSRGQSRFEDIFTEKTKALVGRLQIVSLGGPYRTTSDSSEALVPYAVRFTNGDIQRNNLRLTKDPDGHWVWLGGF